MKRYLFAMLLASLCMTQARGQYDLYVEVESAGTLEEVVSQISETAKYNTTSMKVFGCLNGKDMMFLREMCGVKGNAQPTEGQLKVLDLSSTYIVSSDESYFTLYGEDRVSTNDHFGTCFLYNCRTLEQLMLPESIVSIDTLALANCKNLQYIDIPIGVSYIGYGAFVGCDNVTSLVVPNEVKEVGVGAFQQMARLKELTLGDSIKEVDNSLVLNDDSLEIINFGVGFRQFNPVVFYTAQALKEIFVSYDNPYYSSDDGVLYSANRDTIVTFPPALQVEDFVIPLEVRCVAPYAFCNARFLQSVTCSPSLQTIDSLAFFGCVNLSKVLLNDGLTHIGYGAFGMPYEEESMLEQLTIPASVSDIEGGAFILNTALANLEVDEENPYYITDENGALFTKDYKRICYVPCLADGVLIPEQVEEVGAYAFAGVMGMPDIYIPDNVKEIGEGAFAFATGLTALTLGKGIEKVGDLVVDYCVALENLYLFADDIADDNLQEYSFLDESGAVMEQCVLNVLPGKVMNYFTKKGFYSGEYEAFFFADIVEMDQPDGLKQPAVRENNSPRRFDLSGRLLNAPTRGINIIKPQGSKAIKRFER